MKREIKDPYKFNWKLYLSILAILVIAMVAVVTAPENLNQDVRDILENLLLGCLASTIVALLVDLGNNKEKNERANSIYFSVYSELQYHIADYIGTWAQMCSVAFRNKEKDYKKEKHTWVEWYELTKKEFHECEEARRKEIMSFFVDTLKRSVEDTNKSIQKILSQRYILEMNGIYNRKMKNIIEDYRFEFYAAELVLKRCADGADDFWSSFDAITLDMRNYISNWVDIRYYNDYAFMPYKMFE